MLRGDIISFHRPDSVLSMWCNAGAFVLCTLELCSCMFRGDIISFHRPDRVLSMWCPMQCIIYVVSNAVPLCCVHVRSQYIIYVVLDCMKCFFP